MSRGEYINVTGDNLSNISWLFFGSDSRADDYGS